MKIILSDNTEIPVTLNATTFVSQNEVTAADFKGKLSRVQVVDDEGNVEVMEDCVLDSCFRNGDEWYICLHEPTEQEKMLNRTQAVMTALTGGEA